MRTNADGIALIKSFEKCRLAAYQDGTGRWTVGWGHTSGAHEGLSITQAEADQLFDGDVQRTETILQNLLPGNRLTANQFSALVSFCFNVGWGHVGVKDGFQILKSGEPSTMLKLLRAQDMPSAAAEFTKWKFVGGLVCEGIVRRRLAEAALFLKEDDDGENNSADRVPERQEQG